MRLLKTLLPTLLIFVAGIAAIRGITRLVSRLLSRSKLERAAHSLIRTAISTLLYLLLALTVASGLGIDVTGIIALASVLTLAISLSVQNALTNVISGFTLLYTKPFSSGDYVEVAGQAGSVDEIGLTYTKLATPDNKYVFIPNGAVTSAQIVNYTVLGKRRVDIRINAAYSYPTSQILSALEEAGQVDTIIKQEGIHAVVEGYGEYAVLYSLRVWTDSHHYWDTLFAVNENIKRVFDERGIAMTYPHLNVHLDK